MRTEPLYPIERVALVIKCVLEGRIDVEEKRKKTPVYLNGPVGQTGQKQMYRRKRIFTFELFASNTTHQVGVYRCFGNMPAW